MHSHRIVSLIPSGTEIVAALGFESELVGRSHECDFPELVTSLPICTAADINVAGTSRQIDDDVRARLKEAVSLYRVLEEELERLQPTLIITQAQCEVCAVSLEEVEAAVCRMIGSQPDIVSLEPMQLADVWDDILRVAAALDVPERGTSLVARCRQRLNAIQIRTNTISHRPRVACIEWIDPLMAAGNWVPELIEIAGGECLFGETGFHSPWLDWERLVAADPDVIVVMPCGFGIDRCHREMSILVEQEGWSDLRAVRNNQVHLTDGNQYFNRPGPRLVESAEILAEILHPAQFDFGHRGIDWRAFESA